MWDNLPTELKERIIHFCMHRSDGFEFQPTTVRRLIPHSRSTHRKGRELISQLGSWSALLCVNRQMRAIALRLCFVGNSGLRVVAYSYYDFRDTLKSLERCLQLVEPDSMPSDDRTRALAMTYRSFPTIYPELKHFATFRHGIRRLYLHMDFLDYFHFFKVTTASFWRYWRPASRSTDYEVLQQLPYLAELAFLLPDADGWLEDQTYQRGPLLFYGEGFNCPRLLHRLIYERAAEVLTQYENIVMSGFIDRLESERFKTLRNNAMEASKFHKKDLEELYANDGGGIELENSFTSPVPIQNPKMERMTFSQLDEAAQAFWPPKCRCAVRCELVVQDQENGGF